MRGVGHRRVAPKRKLILGVIAATPGALIQGCTANKPLSQEETSLANAAKDVAFPLEAGFMRQLWSVGVHLTEFTVLRPRP